MSNLQVAGGTLFGYGCGAPVFAAGCFNQTGVVIHSTAVDDFSAVGRIDTVAHEVGHVLGLGHDTFGAGDADNLMTSGDDRTVPQALVDINPDGAALSKLNALQIAEARSSSFVIALVPEPGSLALAGLALAGAWMTNRRREKPGRAGRSFA